MHTIQCPLCGCASQVPQPGHYQCPQCGGTMAIDTLPALTHSPQPHYDAPPMQSPLQPPFVAPPNYVHVQVATGMPGKPPSRHAERRKKRDKTIRVGMLVLTILYWGGVGILTVLDLGRDPRATVAGFLLTLPCLATPYVLLMIVLLVVWFSLRSDD